MLRAPQWVMVQSSKFRPVQRIPRLGDRVVPTVFCIGLAIVIWISSRGQGDSPQAAMQGPSNTLGNTVNAREGSTVPDESKLERAKPISAASKTKIKHVVPRNSLGQRGYVLRASKQPESPGKESTPGTTNQLVNSSVRTTTSFHEALVANKVAPPPTFDQLAQIDDDPHHFENTVERVEAALRPLLGDRKRERVQLISLNRFGAVRVVIGDSLPTVQQLARIELGTREPESIELEAVERFHKGETTIVKTTKATVSVVTAIRTRDRCQKCHSQDVGEVIGAITMRYREVGAADPENLFNSL